MEQKYIYILRKRTCDGAMHYGAVLQFYGNRLVVELHKKPGAYSQKESIIRRQTATSFQSCTHFSREEQKPSLGQNARRNRQNAS
jgi:hypothetical protein